MLELIKILRGSKTKSTEGGNLWNTPERDPVNVGVLNDAIHALVAAINDQFKSEAETAARAITNLDGVITNLDARLAALEAAQPKPKPEPLQVGDRVVLRATVLDHPNRDGRLFVVSDTGTWHDIATEELQREEPSRG